MFYIYILYSSNSNKYYTGYTDNIERRLFEHNNSELSTFTSKYRPWEIAALFECGNDRGNAIKIEKFIKRQKSKKFLEDMINGKDLYGMLAQLVRVPHMRN